MLDVLVGSHSSQAMAVVALASEEESLPECAKVR